MLNQIIVAGIMWFCINSYRGAAVEYPLNEFVDAWGQESLNYYAIFVHLTGNNQ